MKIINLRNVQCSPILNTTSSDQAKKLDKFSLLLEMFQLRVQLVCVSMRKHRAPYRAVVTGFILHCRGSFGYGSMEVVSCGFLFLSSLLRRADQLWGFWTREAPPAARNLRGIQYVGEVSDRFNFTMSFRLVFFKHIFTSYVDYFVIDSNKLKFMMTA